MGGADVVWWVGVSGGWTGLDGSMDERAESGCMPSVGSETGRGTGSAIGERRPPERDSAFSLRAGWGSYNLPACVRPGMMEGTGDGCGGEVQAVWCAITFDGQYRVTTK